MELDRAITNKFDAVLQRVKDTQSELTLAELGLVKKFSYHEAEKTIVVHLDVQENRIECLGCAAVNGFVVESISRDIIAAMQTEFPGWTIEVQ
jgi:hypothetical protein